MVYIDVQLLLFSLMLVLTSRLSRRRYDFSVAVMWSISLRPNGFETKKLISGITVLFLLLFKVKQADSFRDPCLPTGDASG